MLCPSIWKKNKNHEINGKRKLLAAYINIKTNFLLNDLAKGTSYKGNLQFKNTLFVLIIYLSALK